MRKKEEMIAVMLLIENVLVMKILVVGMMKMVILWQ
jgi:hypothetical protein